MQKWLIGLIGATMVIALLTGCARAPPPAATPDAPSVPTATEDAADDLSQDLNELNQLDEDLALDELDSLDEDLAALG